MSDTQDCNCGWGGTHDPDNPRCVRNQGKTPMSDTQDIIARLRIGQHFLFGERVPFTLDIEAADRLTELTDQAFDAEVMLDTIDALRPPCPTCGGSTDILKPHPTDPLWLVADNCPDCTDGRMPLERMARIVNAVYDTPWIEAPVENTAEFDSGVDATLDHLRGIT